MGISSSLMTLVVPRPEFVSVGARVRAKYAADGQYYDAYIHKISDADCVVEYVGYKELATVNIGDLLPAATSTGDKGPGKRVLPKVTIDEDGSIVVPEHLKVKPTDTEEEREAKRKKVHQLKSAARLQKHDQVHEGKKSTWQSFQAKKASKSKGPKKESIFRTTDSGRVGVTGSGKPLTEFTDRSLFRQLAKNEVPLPSDLS